MKISTVRAIIGNADATASPSINAEFLRLTAGMTNQEIEQLTGAHRVTLARWHKGESPIPNAVMQLLRLWRTVNAETIHLPADFDRRVNPSNPRWAGYRPRWLREAEQPVTIAPLAFKQYRAYVLCMSIQQCAAFLRVEISEVEQWEAGTAPIPYAAYIALRLVADIEYLPHQVKAWADWWIIPDGEHVGMLLNRRTGAMLSEGEANAHAHYVNASKRAAMRAEKEIASLHEQVDTLTAENTRLRQLFNAQGVTQELRQMQKRMTALLASIGTAEIIDYAPAKAGKHRRTAA